MLSLRAVEGPHDDIPNVLPALSPHGGHFESLENKLNVEQRACGKPAEQITLIDEAEYISGFKKKN